MHSTIDTREILYMVTMAREMHERLKDHVNSQSGFGLLRCFAKHMVKSIRVYIEVFSFSKRLRDKFGS